MKRTSSSAGAGVGARDAKRLGLAAVGLAVAVASVAIFRAGCGSTTVANGPSAGTAARVQPARQASIPIIDMHVHLSPAAVPRLQGLMKRYGIERVVNLSGGDPLTGLDEQLRAASTATDEIVVFVSLPYAQARYPNYGERMARLIAIGHARGARGVKIAKLLGLGLPGPDGELLRVDDPGLDAVFETAGELGMPVAIHTGDPEAFWLPVDANNPRQAELEAHPGWALYGKNVPSFDELQGQLEARIARHPRTTFISVHFGNDAEHPDRVAEMLRKYPNLYIDTAARIPELGRHAPARMQAFFIEFQDRILYGSDLGVGPEPSPLFLGSEGAQPSTAADRERFFSASRRYFETADENFEHPTPIQGNWKISGIALPEDVLQKVYHDNAARLLAEHSRFTPGAGSGTPQK